MSVPVAESFKGLDFSRHGSQWDNLWKQQSTPWDRSTPSPALSEALSLPRFSSSSSPAAADGPPRKRALVPGCGRGYDVLLLASYGYDAVGLDTSATAIQAAEHNARTVQDTAPEYALKTGVRERGSVRWVVADFFATDLAAQLGGPFDLIYDYTFLCALPVNMRPRWAAQMAALLGPAGALVCLEFPIGKPPATGGPPHGLQSSAYMALLSAPGTDVQYDEAGEAVGAAPTTAEGGLVRVEYFKPAKTHEVGYNEDGTIKDNVSVWEHL